LPAGVGGAPPAGAREAAVAREPSRWRRILHIVGPGIISGAADEDPATIGTCAQLGAGLGFATLWTVPLIYPLMAAVQYITAKIGLVTGHGLAGVIRKHYPPWLLYPVLLGLVIANTINAGADLGAVGAAVNLLCPRIPIAATIVPVAAVLIALQAWGSYQLIERIFKWLTLSLLAYIGSALLCRPNFWQVLWHTFVPPWRFDRDYVEGLVAIAGTTFSPYLYFWQSSQEVEQKIALGRKKPWQRRGTTDAELRYAAWDVNLGMVLCNLVTYAIILSTAATLFKEGWHDVESADQAARALVPIAGPAAGILLAIGLIGAGFLAVPVLTTSAAYALAEAFRWRRGLNRKPGQAPYFYVAITLITIVAMEINYVGLNPIKALYWTSIIYGFLSPPLLLLLMLVSGSRRVMGDRVNGLWTNLFGWVSVVLTFLAAAALAWLWFR
jgi:NRAMP (natural resistance-associated macrophage protein)-like metal ion transporter